MNVNQSSFCAAKHVLNSCMGIKPSEQLLIVTDENALEVAYSFVKAGRDLGIKTLMIEMPSQKGGEPPDLIATALSQADVALLVTSFSLSHTAARHEATKRGVRIASMPMITEEIVQTCLRADYDEIATISNNLAKLLTKGREVRITTDKGTHLTIDISNRKGLADTGLLREKGDFGNLPAGEALIAPLEGKGDGILVVDGAIAGVGKLQSPIKLEIKNGKIENIEGGSEKECLIEMLKQKDENAWKIAEFGIGTNREVKLMGNVLVDEKVYGTIHIGFGNNCFMGGVQDSNIHYDCIVLEPTVYIDDKCIINKGKHV